ncbi:ORF6N domain-containing protein [Hydrogenimonas cancrithermarum]|uniref:KilA-N DNA-binding domain-containing protein n=1 Tax=Hydrogenimonas cancrithermarum TaxID=2993563 RepID=A0ABM8FJL1_9BACT|nr:ORF6N domain-containing protein [Hydrogenimonas cancrithermarum]BDY12474.1 hypothetical protein HCR_07860 [Hydrogenimonas cancrithermarum]
MHELIVSEESIQNRIFTIRGQQVMLDSDLALLYNVETKQLNKAVSRNLKRFPEHFRFQLTQEEFDNLRYQNGTSSQNSKRHGGRRYLPYAFTEQGVSMLSAVRFKICKEMEAYLEVLGKEFLRRWMRGKRL